MAERVAEVTVAIVTRDRPDSLGRLLESLDQAIQPDSDVTFEICVIDNSDDRSAEAVARSTHVRAPVAYHHEPRTGIPIARNRALDETRTPYIAFVDDDETVRPGWLSYLVEAATRTGHEAVRGPVFERTAPGTPPWVHRSGAFVSVPLKRDGLLTFAPTNNIIVNMSFVRQHGLRFDEWRPLMGGSDVEFFRALTAAGGRISWCEDALVDEHVQDSRGSVSAVLRRSFRKGYVPAVRQLRRSPTVKTRAVLIGKALRSLFEGVLFLPLSATRGLAAPLASARQIATALGTLSALRGRTYDYYERVDR